MKQLEEEYNKDKFKYTEEPKTEKKKTDVEGQDPICGKITNASTTWRLPVQTICVTCSTCVKTSYCKTYGNNIGSVERDSIIITGTNGKTLSCSFPAYVTTDKTKLYASYSCSLSYDSKNNKLSISGTASNGATVTKKTIDGSVVTGSITPTKSKTYNGVVYFSDGHQANCSKSVKIPEVNHACTLKYNSSQKTISMTTYPAGVGVTYKEINGVSGVNSITIKAGGQYCGSVIFADGKSAKCCVTVNKNEFNYSSAAGKCCYDSKLKKYYIASSCTGTYVTEVSLGYCR